MEFIIRVASIKVTWFHVVFRVNTLNSEEETITVESSSLKASFKRWIWNWDIQSRHHMQWEDLHKQRDQGGRLNTYREDSEQMGWTRIPRRSWLQMLSLSFQLPLQVFNLAIVFKLLWAISNEIDPKQFLYYNN